MSRKPSFRERLRYWFDSWMSRGTGAIMGLLGLTTIVFVIVMAAIVVLLHAFPDDADEGDFWDIAWGNLMRTLDPGTMGGDTGWRFRVLMLVVTVGGLVIVAGLIGIVSAAFDAKMMHLREGRSHVLEHDHTVILGWSPQLFRIVHEICLADASLRYSAIVILANRDKVEMENEIRSRVPDHRHTSIICRSGDPMSMRDLQMVSTSAARSVLMLGDGYADPDLAVIKIALALTKHLTEANTDPNIVAALHDPDNLDAARLAGRNKVHWLLPDTLILRIMAQTCRQSGLSTVYSELLDFEGDEIYHTPVQTLEGRTYLDAQFAFPDAAVIGVVRSEGVMLNPAPGQILKKADLLLVIAEDDSVITAPTARRADFPTARAGTAYESAPPEHTLILGCNDQLPELLTELAHYVPAGSSACVVAPDAPLIAAPEALAVRQHQADPTNRQVLESLVADGYDHVLVLADRSQPDPQMADTRTLVTLLHLREIADRDDLNFNIVSEMRDDRNREIADVARADDFIVSDRLVGLLLAQVSEDALLHGVFEELFVSEGSEIYLRPVSLYVDTGEETDFYAAVSAAAVRGETAIGYRIAAEVHDPTSMYGVHINPHKPDRITFAAGDTIIVLAER